MIYQFGDWMKNEEIKIKINCAKLIARLLAEMQIVSRDFIESSTQLSKNFFPYHATFSYLIANFIGCINVPDAHWKLLYEINNNINN